MKNIIYCILTSVIFFSCNTEENQQLRSENQQLQEELNNINQSTEEKNNIMSEIDILLDSIETNEKIVKINLERGINYEDYQARIKKY